MKVNVHIEADDADIRRLATEMLARSVKTFARSAFEAVGHPDFAKGMGAMLQQGVMMAAAAGGLGRVPVADPVASPKAPPPMGCIHALADTHEGTLCCQCGKFNSASRAVCHGCGHALCGGRAPVVTPPPAAPGRGDAPSPLAEEPPT